jgi:DNA-directed RNA polymerase, omega subunit
MARVFVEECLEKVPNRFDLVVIAGHRARQMSRLGAAPRLADASKPTVVALREIAAAAVNPEEIRDDLVRSLQRHVEVDEPEAPAEVQPAVEADAPEDVGQGTFGGMSEEDLLTAIEGLEPPDRQDED